MEKKTKGKQFVLPRTTIDSLHESLAEISDLMSEHIDASFIATVLFDNFLKLSDKAKMDLIHEWRDEQLKKASQKLNEREWTPPKKSPKT